MNSPSIPTSSFTITDNVLSGAVPTYYNYGSTTATTAYGNVLFFCLSQAGNAQKITVEFYNGNTVIGSATCANPATAGHKVPPATPMLGTISGEGVTTDKGYIFNYVGMGSKVTEIKATFTNASGKKDVNLFPIGNSPQGYGATTATGPLNTMYTFVAEDIGGSDGGPNLLDAQLIMIFSSPQS